MMRVDTLVALGHHLVTWPRFWRSLEPIPEFDISCESLAKLLELWYNRVG
jgi:hypothetical protein